MRRILLVLLSLVLLAATVPARAAESPPRFATAEIVRIFEGLWDLLFTLGGDMDPDGLQGEGDRGGDMDPNGAATPQGDLGGDMDPNG